jgi:hypothetical protein
MLGALALPERVALVTRPIGNALPVARVRAASLDHPPDSLPLAPDRFAGEVGRVGQCASRGE